MDAAITTEPPRRRPSSASPSGALAGLLGPGVMLLGPGGSLRFADRRALELLGWAGSSGLESLWAQLKSRLETAGLSWSGAVGQPALELPAAEGRTSRLSFDYRRDPADGGVLLVQDLEVLTGLETDLRLTSLMRSLAQISPAGAHDLRAPINAMVFAIEILREMIASGRAADPANRDKLLHRVNVLNEELQRLHGGLETFLAYISPRSDKQEILDLRELAAELASLLVAPARKQQVQVQAALPAEPLPVEGNRYLLRQALLHLALAALTSVPRTGRLQLSLERRDDRARLRIHGMPGEQSPLQPEAAAEPLPDFELRLSSAGAQAELWAARTILAAHGGEARPAVAGGARAYEVELTLLGKPRLEKE